MFSLFSLQQCEILARAMKEWDRRPGERAGFTDSPGDCMAFKYLRDVRGQMGHSSSSRSYAEVAAAVAAGATQEQSCRSSSSKMEIAAAVVIVL